MGPTVSTQHMPLLAIGFLSLTLLALLGIGVGNYLADKF